MHTLYPYELETFNIRISLAVSLACPTVIMIMNNKGRIQDLILNGIL
jgi:hypothetical protein